ncbi:MAG: glycosyltransferase family 4 protein [Phycisphaeraceae bacterium]|nr:glycosyltransferase family 4 protein [Phycisphaeraceae bacterium]
MSEAGTASAHGATTGRPPRVVIMHQFYVPDVASTGQLLHDLGSDLVKNGFEVEVISTRPSYGPPETWQPAPLKEIRDGVKVTRMLTTRKSKDRLIGRALNSGTYLAQLFLKMLFTSRRDTVYMYVMNPPFIVGVSAMVSLLRRHRYVLVLQDSYPQLAVWVGKISKGGLIERVWHWMNKVAYRRATETIVICPASKRLVVETYGADPARVHEVSNWADGDQLKSKPKAESRFAMKHNLVDPFVALYSGNLGLYYEYETLLGAAALLKDENFRLVFIGAGGKKAWLGEQIKKRGLTNTMLLPYVPSSELPDSLTACDTSLVTIAKGIEGISYPSKLYSALAVGRPILAISEDGSDLQREVVGEDVGQWHPVGDAAGLAEGIRSMMREKDRMNRQGLKARALFERKYTRQVSVARYAEILELAARNGGKRP